MTNRLWRWHKLNHEWVHERVLHPEESRTDLAKYMRETSPNETYRVAVRKPRTPPKRTPHVQTRH